MKNNAEDVLAALEHKQSQAVIRCIFAALDGVEWSSDTLEEVADILRSAGFYIRSPEEAAPDHECGS